MDPMDSDPGHYPLHKWIAEVDGGVCSRLQQEKTDPPLNRPANTPWTGERVLLGG